MRRILFVDDEQAVLDGLKDLLRKERREWDMVFVAGGQAALAQLARSPFDVVVTDLRMPGIDGATVLERAKVLQPAAARIVLSGQADREMMVRAVPLAHQIVSKPCGAEHLRSVIGRACALDTILSDDEVRRLVGRLERLPSVPRTYWELSSAIGDPASSAADVARIVERDPAISARVLQIANSAYFGATNRVVSVTRAVVLVGVELLRGLALTAHLFDEARGDLLVPGMDLEVLQEHAILTARIARLIARQSGQAEGAFSAGLLHDVGKLVLAQGMPKQLAEVVRIAGASGEPLHVVEKRVLGVDHAEVGAYLLRVWGLPSSLVEVVALHHVPGMAEHGPDALAALRVADALANEIASARGVQTSGAREPDLQTQIDRWRVPAMEEARALAG